MPAPYTPLAIANNFVQNFAGSTGIEHMKLQKLVYCSYGWWLGNYGLGGVRLTSEGPQIWKHGPVFESLYHTLKVFGREPITKMQSASPFSEPENIDVGDENARSLVRWIWGRYGHLSSFALSDLTHQPGSPWHRVANENNFRIALNTAIPDQYIYEEYVRLMTGDQVSANTGTENVSRRNHASA
ncbi:Panacea domain-containing protein [Shinella zoogloeoides]